MALKDQLAQAAAKVGKIITVPGAEGGDTTYKTADGAYAEKVGQDRFRVPIVDNVDADGTAGRGAYWAEYDSQGNLVREPYYQHTTNNDWSGLVAFAATALGSYALSQAGLGSLAQAPVSAADMAGAGLGGGVMDAATVGATIPAQSAAAISAATGIPVATLTGAGGLAALAGLPSAVLNGIKSLLPAGVQSAIAGLTGSGMFDLLGGAAALNGVVGASNTAADSYNTLGNEVAGRFANAGQQNLNDFTSLIGNTLDRTQGIGDTLNTRYNDLGTGYSGMLTGLADKGATALNNFGTAAAGIYNGIAGGTKSAYDQLVADTKKSIGTFKPFNISTNVGSTDTAGNFNLTPGMQAVSDNATSAAGSSFGAANDIDVNNLAAQKFAQQQSMLAPYDAQDLAKLRANLAATGRTGVASNATGQAISPELAAYYLSKGTRDAGLLTNADQAALNVRGGLVNQGVAASGVPVNIANQGISQFQTGVNAGNTAFQAGLAGTAFPANLAARGIDATTSAQTHGADTTLPIFGKAVSLPIDYAKQGADTMLSQGNLGLGALTGQLNKGTDALTNLGSTALTGKLQAVLQGLNQQQQNYVASINQRYQGNFAKASLLAKMFSTLGGMTPAAQSAASSGDVATLAAQLLKAGVPQSTIDGVLNGQVSGGAIFNPNGTSTTWGNSAIDPSVYETSIWGF